MELPKAGGAPVAELLPKTTGSVFCGVGTFAEPNRFVAEVLVFAPKPPKTGVAAVLLNDGVDAPNAGGAAVVVVALLWLNVAPKLGIVVVVALLNAGFVVPKPIDAVVFGTVVEVPKRFGTGD